MERQFLVIEHDCEGEELRIMTEEQVSKRIDMGDYYPGPCSIFTLVNGKLEPVEVGKIGPTRYDDATGVPCFHYADSDLVAAGQVVGSVAWTDH